MQSLLLKNPLAFCNFWSLIIEAVAILATIIVTVTMVTIITVTIAIVQ